VHESLCDHRRHILPRICQYRVPFNQSQWLSIIASQNVDKLAVRTCHSWESAPRCVHRLHFDPFIGHQAIFLNWVQVFLPVVASNRIDAIRHWHYCKRSSCVRHRWKHLPLFLNKVVPLCSVQAFRCCSGYVCWLVSIYLVTRSRMASIAPYSV
jgi:hypothetical protein